MNSQKLSEPLHNLIMKSEPALADLHRIPDATSKWAVEGLSRSAAYVYADWGIRATSSSPASSKPT